MKVGGLKLKVFMKICCMSDKSCCSHAYCSRRGATLSQDKVKRLPKHSLRTTLQQLKGDSGCDTDNSSETQIYIAKGPCLPPTPPNSQNIPLQDRQWCQDHRMLKHMQFLQCLSGLRRVCELSLCRDGDVVWDSVVQLLDSVVEVFRQAHVGQPVHHPEQLHHATQTVAQTLSLGGTRHGCSVQHFSKVEDLLKEMISLLLTNQQFNAFSVHGVLLECLLALGGSCVLRTSFIQLLMSQTIQLAQQLWETCEIESGHSAFHNLLQLNIQRAGRLRSQPFQPFHPHQPLPAHPGLTPVEHWLDWKM
ncbi:meiosis-specific protein MEI4 isoform X2 [Megalobrama amblycephala]|uniref:meiosis-specific protein MEI4 isoform X2 n=1 Tax=Megalobrama amblycephala TaxID=75352 RepID=UPI00201466D1|nr:meiosis-specific protein MEI4 isoform X2 [Megalobrama amblycephala]